MNSDVSDITRQVTNAVVHFLELDTNLKNSLRDVDECEAARLIDYAYKKGIGTSVFMLGSDLIAIALLYCNWDAVIARLKGETYVL